MSRHVNAYRHVQAQSWTRVDMLLALYDKALLMVEAGIHLLEQGRFEAIPPARVQVQRLLLGLIEGMDLENDDTSRKMAQVLMFAIRRSSVDDPSAWRDALRIIQPLRDGFAEIRDQAAAAERRGEIPPLDWRTPVAFSA
jgi:flagellar protein FliS